MTRCLNNERRLPKRLCGPPLPDQCEVRGLGGPQLAHTRTCAARGRYSERRGSSPEQWKCTFSIVLCFTSQKRTLLILLTCPHQMSGVSQDPEPGTLHELKSTVAGRQRAVGDPGDQPLKVPAVARSFVVLLTSSSRAGFRLPWIALRFIFALYLHPPRR